MKLKAQFLVILALVILVSLFLFTKVNHKDEHGTESPALTAEGAPTADLLDQVIEIFENDCSTPGCHSGSKPKKGLNLEMDEMMAELIDVPSIEIDKLKLIDTARPQQSYLLMKIRGDEGIADHRMPVEAPPLTADKIKIIEEWVLSLSAASLDN